MVKYSKDAQKSIDDLFYFPYTFGKHLDKAVQERKLIADKIENIKYIIGVHSILVSGVGNVQYTFDGKTAGIIKIDWCRALRSFYYNKSNFATFTSAGNIVSAHPALYTDCAEDSFKCDNGFQVVSRTYRGKEVFNFKNEDGDIISEIDFTQVKPFSADRDMTARGHTPNRRCYAIYANGNRKEVNESLATKRKNLPRVLEARLLRLSHGYCPAPKHLNEKFHNPSKGSMIDGRVGEYDVLDGEEWEQFIPDIAQKGWVEDIRMYSALPRGGKTYCLYRRAENGKYFFVEIYDDGKDKEHSHARVLTKDAVPALIMKDALSYINEVQKF